MPRLYCPAPLSPGLQLDLPAGAARHAQVLRLQPGDGVTLFNGEDGEWDAAITRMGRQEVAVQVGAYHALEREAPRAVRLALGMPANDRMDWLVEKATELGAISIEPLVCERSVLRLAGERAQKKQAHWQAIAVAACEQCGRNRVPQVGMPTPLAAWLDRLGPGATDAPGPGGPSSAQGAAGRSDWPERRLVLSTQPDAFPISQWARSPEPVLLLSGPEGGLSPAEMQATLRAGFEPVTLGPRVLRAETAPLAALSLLTLSSS